jgi:hypothetical protein
MKRPSELWIFVVAVFGQLLGIAIGFGMGLLIAWCASP